MPTTLLTGFRLRASGVRRSGRSGRAGTRSLYPGANRCHLTFDGGQQVVDVIALQQESAESVERFPLLGGCRVAFAVPPRAQRLQLRFVLVALAVDRLAGSLQAFPECFGRGTGLTRFPDPVELLVQ